MFYQKALDDTLRFGDVVRGFVLASPNLEGPASHDNYRIDVSLPSFCVVLSPCCSIGGKLISLSPLIEVRGSFFDNPFFEEDLTRINRKMEPQQAVAPHVWRGFSSEEKQKRLDEGYAYAFLEVFIYEKHDLLPKYRIHRKRRNLETNYYMIDFRNTCKLNCEKIVTPKNAPLESNCLQLTTEARSELRDKIAYYYGRIPEEDEILKD
ncbi:MAG: hypothetical protein AMJ73_09365 [candidate division Zixibacteria bacterium SM1_73]|nr:MAG: hypothetical protein AMJ73_09365 [candidate division Zixibacteria bacterium SM1_73]